MTTAPRLHLVSNLPACDDFEVEFRKFEGLALALQSQPSLLAADVWALAQYADLVGAGYGDRADALHLAVLRQLGVFISESMHTPSVRAMCGRSVTLADLAESALGRQYCLKVASVTCGMLAA